MSNHEADGERPSKRPRLSPVSQNGTESSSHPAESSNMNKSAHSGNLMADTREIEVGITEFVSQDVIPFQALLKKRYTDFMVNEILPDGEVIHLTDTSPSKQSLPSGPSNNNTQKTLQDKSIPSDRPLTDDQARPPSDKGHSQQTNITSNDSNQDLVEPRKTGEITDEDKKQLTSFLDDNVVRELLELYQNILKYPTRKPKDHPTVRTEFTSDRALRAQIHGTIRKVFSSKIESSTDKDGFLCLTAAKPNTGRSNNRNAEDGTRKNYPGKLGWLERGGEYLHFTLYKENKDTMEAISFLTRQLKTNSKIFQFAGTKDKRAVSSQRVSAYRLDAERLAKQNYHLRNAAVGNFEYKPSSLELGDLGGNEFILTLRECQFVGLSELLIDDALPKVQSALDLALSNLRTKGFLNYYGLQRFGTFTTRTDTIGLHILKNDFRSACEGILQYDSDLLADIGDGDGSEVSTPNPNAQSRGRDDINRAKAIQLFQKTNHAHKPLELLPRKFSAENQLIRHLSRSPTDYIGALLVIPRNLRLMYVHAYQSIVWNKAVSHRWQHYGSAVVEGDLVLIKEHEAKESTQATTPEEDSTNVDADGEIIIVPSSHDRSNQLDDIFDRARALTSSEAASGQYSIFDVVLPLPGYDVIYPTNASGQFYKDFMASDEGGGLDPYDMRRRQKDFSLSGGYRKVMACVGEVFDVKVHRYKRDEEQFVQTDLEKLNAGQSRSARKGEATDIATGEDSKMQDVANQPDASAADDVAVDETTPDKIAAVLKFQLGASQYATMALRELSRGGVVAYKADFGGGRG